MNPGESTSTIAVRLDVNVAAVDTSRDTPASVHTTPHGDTSDTKIGDAQPTCNRPADVDGDVGDVGGAVTSLVQLDDASAAANASAVALSRLGLVWFMSSASRADPMGHTAETAQQAASRHATAAGERLIRCPFA